MATYQLRKSRVSAEQFIDGAAIPVGVEALATGGFALADGTRVTFGQYVVDATKAVDAGDFEAAYELVPESAPKAASPAAETRAERSHK